MLDTRNNTWSVGPAQSGQTLELRVAGRGGVPNDAAAALLTITADSITGGGFVTAWPCDEAMPTASVVNLWAGTVRSNLALVKLSATDGEVCLRPTLYNGSSITLIADAVGWTPGGPSRGPVPAPPAPRPPVPPPGTPGHFATLPVGAALPDRAECAARVRSARRDPSRATRRQQQPRQPCQRQHPHDWSGFNRVDGNFAGTTDEIIQWAACKWGIDEDIVRAQIAKESYWYQSDASATTASRSGLGQVRDTAHQSAFQDSVNARTSSAYNLDYTYATWRGCYEGADTWLNTRRAQRHLRGRRRVGMRRGVVQRPLVLQHRRLPQPAGDSVHLARQQHLGDADVHQRHGVERLHADCTFGRARRAATVPHRP